MIFYHKNQRKNEEEIKSFEEEIDQEKLKEYKSKDQLSLIFKNNEIKENDERPFARLIYWNPNNCSFFKNKLNEIRNILKDEQFYIADFSDEIKKIEIIQKAIISSINRLNEIRFLGIETHKKAHSVATLIHKTILLLKNESYSISDSNIFSKYFREKIFNISISLEKSFDDIYKTLINSNFHKRQKMILLRAFYDNFIKDSELKRLINHDFKYEYYAIYDYCLDNYLNILKNNK